jgi:hypothetical protein
MESLIMELVRHMPVKPLARTMRVSDGALWGFAPILVEVAE